MPQYPSQFKSTPKVAGPPENIKKQITIAVVLTILLTIGWWHWWQISNWITQMVDTNVSTSTIISLPFLRILAIPQIKLTWYKLGISLFAYMFLYALIGLEGLLINKYRLRLIPILISSTIFLANQNDWVLFSLLFLIAVLTQQMFVHKSISSRNLHKKISLTALLLPSNKYLSIGLSILLVMPLYFHLSNNPELTVSFIHKKIINPQVDQLIDWSNDWLPKKTEGNIFKTKNSWGLIETQLEGLISPEIVEKIKSNFDSDKVSTELLNVAKTKNLNQLSSSSKKAIKGQIEKQTDQLLEPFVQYLPILIPLLIFFTLVQILILLGPLLFVFPWLVFQVLLITKVIKISKKEEPVEYLET